ncbi:host attachment protein [Billgrantia sp. LNSP4103-1]|uniref:host attachment protein n=1 Tax=Billgrantia sp. LNSP4103-1 TaxID=3410266 RepID=UPI00403F0992
MSTYIVVADAARARVFTRDALKLEEKENLVHAEGRLHEGDLVTGTTGSVDESTSATRRASRGDSVALDHEAEIFAKQIAERLYKARVENSMDKLILVAPPRFLGVLRNKLDAPSSKLIIHTLDKDLSKASLNDIQEAVSDMR